MASADLSYCTMFLNCNRFYYFSRKHNYDYHKHVQYCESDTGRKSISRPDKLLQTVNMLYDPSLFVSAVGGWVRRR